MTGPAPGPSPMTIGMVGLGRMGEGIARRLRGAGHKVLGFDASPELTETPSLAAMVAGLPAPRIVWVMAPAGQPTEETITELAVLLGAGDIVIDGGNSYVKDTVRRAGLLAAKDSSFLTVGPLAAFGGSITASA